MKPTLFAILILALAGCGHVRPSAIQATGDAIAQTDAHLDSQAPHLAYLAAHSDSDGKVHAESAQAENAAAKKSNGTAGDSFRRVANQLASVLASWAYMIGSGIVRLWWVFLLLLFVSILLRSLGLAMTGPVGAGFSMASHVMLAGATLGASAVHSVLDNVWWRRIKPAQDAAPPPNVDVSQDVPPAPVVVVPQPVT